jgi:hypothetical protein
MAKHEHLLADIKSFCDAHALSPAQFGVLAVNDWKLINGLLGVNRAAPRRLWPETERSIRAFMAGYSGNRPAEHATDREAA